MDEAFGALSTRELGGFLIRNRVLIDTTETKWLDAVAEFDGRGGVGFGGHPSCVLWVKREGHMGHSTAKDRIRVAHDLQRRPVLAAALGDGTLSYAKIKILTRIQGLGDH